MSDIDKKCEKMRRDIFADLDYYGHRGLGCYEVFGLKPDFVQITNLEKYPKLLEQFGWEIEHQIYIHAHANLEYVVMWAWDGYGTLLIWKRGKQKAYINGDCKCTYGWEEVEL